MHISPHFTLSELTRSQTAMRRGLDNQPSPAALLALHDLARHILDPIRLHFGPFSPSSCYRSAALNRAIGSTARSQHVMGEAADIKIAAISNRALLDFIAAELPFDQLILEFLKADDPHHGWLHVSYRREQQRGEILTAQRSKGRVHYAALM